MKKFYFLFSIVLFGLIIVCGSCSNDELTAQQPEQETEGWHSAKARFTIKLEDYSQDGGATRAAGQTWQDGDVVYLLLTDKDGNKVQAYVKYDGTQQTWGDVIYEGYKEKLLCSTERVVEAYFQEGVNTLEADTLTLSNAKAIYACIDGTYVYPDGGDMEVMIALKPLTGRIRFEGTVGSDASIIGIKTFTAFSTRTGKFTESTEPVSTKVEASGSTPYIYCSFLDTTEHALVVTTDKTYKTVFDLSSSILQPGKSGFMSLPTLEDHRGWIPYVFVSSFLLNPESLTLEVGESITIVATFEPENATNKTLTWTSSDPSIATVDENGKVTAIEVGTATITAVSKDYNAKQAECVVEVTDINGHEYVDLGLPSGTLWATMNVGATRVGAYGDYYAWGETSGYNDFTEAGTGYEFTWDVYPWCNGTSTTMTKYCVDPYYGDVDNITELEPEDDVAWQNWGHSWRMPTQMQFQELKEQCTWTWTTQFGNYGYKVTSKKNSNSIFLPAAGYRSTDLDWADSIGYYWSRSLYTSNGDCALVLYFNSYSIYPSSCDYRYYGLSVRPVLNK